MVRMSSTLATELFSTLPKVVVSYSHDTHFATATSLPHAHFARPCEVSGPGAGVAACRRMFVITDL